jgi:hypothetical protein
VFRTLVVSGRRGGGETIPAAAGGDQTYYVASVPGGQADLEVSIVGGIAQAPVMAPGRSLELLPYAVGLVPALDAGFGWNGSGLVAPPYAQRAGQETFETYGLGGISGNAISAGTGWNGNGGLSIPYVQRVAGETFETYDLGGISGSDISDGTGWNGNGRLSNPYAQPVAGDTFETYALGVIDGSGLTDGTGWNGSAAIISH